MKPQSNEALRLRRLFAVGHAAFLAAVYLPLLVYAFAISFNTDVRYFVGWPISLLLLFVVAALHVPLFHTCLRPTTRLISTSVWVPALALIVVAIVYHTLISGVLEAMESRECYASAEKKHLQLSHEAADDLYGVCQTMMGQPPGDPEEVASVVDCPEYAEGSLGRRRAFEYLASLEARFPCSGMCYINRRLWFDPGSLAPPCGMFIAQRIRVAKSQAAILVVCSVLLGILLIPARLLLEPMIEHYNDVLVDKSLP